MFSWNGCFVVLQFICSFKFPLSREMFAILHAVFVLLVLIYVLFLEAFYIVCHEYHIMIWGKPLANTHTQKYTETHITWNIHNFLRHTVLPERWFQCKNIFAETFINQTSVCLNILDQILHTKFLAYGLLPVKLELSFKNVYLKCLKSKLMIFKLVIVLSPHAVERTCLSAVFDFWIRRGCDFFQYFLSNICCLFTGCSKQQKQ